MRQQFFLCKYGERTCTWPSCCPRISFSARRCRSQTASTSLSALLSQTVDEVKRVSENEERDNMERVSESEERGGRERVSVREWRRMRKREDRERVSGEE